MNALLFEQMNTYQIKEMHQKHSFINPAPNCINPVPNYINPTQGCIATAPTLPPLARKNHARTARTVRTAWTGLLLIAIAILLLAPRTLPASTLPAPTTLEGTILDAQTGLTLPAASIAIKNTYKGTISNAEGRFEIQVDQLPSTLVIRFIGYRQQEILIQEQPPEPLVIRLEPEVLEMDEVVVTGEDPGLSIMEQVIARKQIWQAQLFTYEADAYTRQRLENDSTIVSISESASTVYWNRNNGFRERQIYKNQTSNIDENLNFAGVSFFPNLYADNIEISGFTLVGITHPDAPDFYRFSLQDVGMQDGKLLYTLEVTPKRTLQPLFQGVIKVLDEDFALLEADLTPNDVVRFPPPIQDFSLSYRQQFSNYGRDFWLPVDMKIEGLIKIGMVGLEFPLIRFRQVSQVTEYRVNQPLPAGIFEQESRFITSYPRLTEQPEAMRFPLSDVEEKAYATIDSTQTLEKAFQPTGFLAQFAVVNNGSAEPDTSRPRALRFSGAASFNRVDGYTLGANVGFRKERNRFRVDVQPVWHFNSKESGVRIESRILLIDGRADKRSAGGGVRGDGASGGDGEGGREGQGASGMGEGRGGSVSGESGGEVASGRGGEGVSGESGGDVASGRRGQGRGRRDNRNRTARNPFRLYLYADYVNDTQERWGTRTYPQVLSSAVAVLGGVDSGDYFRNEGWMIELEAEMPLPGQPRIAAGILHERHTSFDASLLLDESLTGWHGARRPNPTIDDGRLTSLILRLGNTTERRRETRPAGFSGQRSFQIQVEHSLSSTLRYAPYPSQSFANQQSEAASTKLTIAEPPSLHFTHVEGEFRWTSQTFYKRRFFPNTLNLIARAGLTLGDLPLQRFSAIDGSLFQFSPFGVLKTRRNLPYEGDRFWLVAAEHNFQSIPFELLRLKSIVESGTGIILFAAAGQTATNRNFSHYQPYISDGIHLEGGLSVNRIFGIFRTDIAFRLDKPGFFVGVSVPRYF